MESDAGIKNPADQIQLQDQKKTAEYRTDYITSAIIAF